MPRDHFVSICCIIYLATFGMICLNFVFKKYKWSKVRFSWKNWPLTLEHFSVKTGPVIPNVRRIEIIDLHIKRVFVEKLTLNDKLFLPVKLFDPGLKLLEIPRMALRVQRNHDCSLKNLYVLVSAAGCAISRICNVTLLILIFVFNPSIFFSKRTTIWWLANLWSSEKAASD